MPFRTKEEVIQWIRWADVEYQAAKTEQDQARQYYENYQAPDNVPTDINYIIRNLGVDYVDRNVSKLVGARVDVDLPGAGPREETIKRLLNDIIEKNKFREFLLEKHANNLHVEGIAYWKVVFNPYKIGPYGLGFPEIYSLKPEEGRLDPNSISPYHEDDSARSHIVFKNVKELKEKYPEFANQIGNYGGSNQPDKTGAATNLQLARVDEVEFKRTYMVPARYDPTLKAYVPLEMLDDDFIPEGETEADFVGAIKPIDKNKLPKDVVMIESEQFFVCKVVNLSILVEKPQKSDFSGFSIIPTLASVHSTGKHKYSKSRLMYLKDTQDRINITSSIALEISKRSLKNPVIISGASEDDITEVQSKISGIGSMIVIRKTGVGVDFPTAKGISPHVLQQLTLDLQAFEDIANTSNPDRGQTVEGSGRKVIALISRTDLPQFVIQTHFKSSLTEVFRRLVEILPKMDHEFEISAMIGSKEQTIKFNADAGDESGLEIDVVEDGKLNPLKSVRVPNVKIDIDINSLAREEININKAVTMFDKNALAMSDLHKAVYPEKWPITLKNITEQNRLLQLVSQIEQLSQDGKQLVEEFILSTKLAQDLTDAAQKVGNIGLGQGADANSGNGTLPGQNS